MVLVLEGTFALGWTAELGAVVHELGYDAVVLPALEPFALLLERAERIRQNWDCVIVCSRADLVCDSPDIERVLRDLTTLLLGDHAPHVHRLQIDAEPHEFFMKCVADGHDERATTIRSLVPDEKPPLKRLCVPAYAIDTPAIVRQFVKHGLSDCPGAVRADLEPCRRHGPDQNGRRDVSWP